MVTEVCCIHQFSIITATNLRDSLYSLILAAEQACIADTDIIFCSCGLFMAALCSRCRHYIFAMWFLLSFFSSPNLSRRRLDICHILAHMVWPQCEFKMQVWNVLHAARWKYMYMTQKWCKKSPYGRHRTTLSGYVFATKARIDNRKKLVKQQYVLHMSS